MDDGSEVSDPRPPRSVWGLARPTVGTAVLLLLLLIPTAGLMWMNPSFTPSGPLSACTSYGPDLVLVTWSFRGAQTTTQVEVDWPRCIGLLFCGYMLARCVVAGVERRLGTCGARRLLWWTPAGLVLAAILCGGAASRWYWGYWWSRPSAEPIADHLERVTHVSFVRGYDLDAGEYADMAWDLDTTVEREVRIPAAEADGEYYAFNSRLLQPLDERNLLPLFPDPVPEEDLARLQRTLTTDHVLDTPEPHYREFCAWNKGVVILGADVDGDPILVAGLQGSEVSNDHKPHNEVVFSWPEEGAPKLLDRRHFFYDVAGWEGVEWTFLAMLAWFGLTFLYLPVVLFVGLFPRRRRRPPG